MKSKMEERSDEEIAIKVGDLVEPLYHRTGVILVTSLSGDNLFSGVVLFGNNDHYKDSLGKIVNEFTKDYKIFNGKLILQN